MDGFLILFGCAIATTGLIVLTPIGTHMFGKKHKWTFGVITFLIGLCVFFAGLFISASTD